MQGYPEGPEVGSIFMDGASGPEGANAFLMALIQRRRTGLGVVCEMAQVENMICHIGDLTIDAAMNRPLSPAGGQPQSGLRPAGLLPVRRRRRMGGASVRSDEEWLRMTGPPRPAPPLGPARAGDVATGGRKRTTRSTW